MQYRYRSTVSKIGDTYANHPILTEVKKVTKNKSKHVLIRLIEEWRHKRGSGNFVGAVLIDFSKVFDWISHDLLIAKRSVYGLSDEAIAYIFSYLSEWKQSVKIDNCYSIFQLLLSRVLQGQF